MVRGGPGDESRVQVCMMYNYVARGSRRRGDFFSYMSSNLRVLCFLQQVKGRDPEWKKFRVRYCYVTQWVLIVGSKYINFSVCVKACLMEDCLVNVSLMMCSSQLTRLSWFEGEVLMWCVEGVLVVVSVPAFRD